MMAIYHLSAGFVSRSTGRSSVQSAAYITGTVLEETRREITADYRNRSSDIIFSTTLAPEHAPDFAKNLKVWDALENYEDSYAMLRYKTEATQEQYKNHAQTAQTIVVALPKELTPEVWKGLVTEFAMDRFVSRGLVVTLGIHNDEGNPHAHFQVSRRSINAEGEWSWAKDREITTKASLRETRKLWAEKTNLYLEKEGFLERVDHRSFLDMGLPFEPTRHEGWFAHKLERMGVSSRIIEENKDIKGRNKERVAFEPEAILKELCTKQATFSAMDLARLVQTRLGDDAKLASVVYESSLQKAILVGSSLDGQARYSSPQYVAKETEALQWAQDFSQRAVSLKIPDSLKEDILKSQYAYLNPEQREAVATLCNDNSLGVLIGRAGTGKTTTLKAVVDIHTESNHKVIGLSLSAAAAENLKREANCEGETIAFYLDKWERCEAVQEKYWSLHPSHEHAGLVTQLGKLMDYGLTKEHLVIVDEAGMVGTTQWHRLLYHVQKAGAKLLAVGDDNQFKAIDAGDFFRKLAATAKTHDTLCSLENILRQKEPWMQEASLSLAELKTYAALAQYENHEFVQKVASGLEGIQFVAKSYTEKTAAFPEQTGLLLASTNLQCEALNLAVRGILKEQGVLQLEDFNIQHRTFSINDKVIFLKNDREKMITLYDANTHRKTADFIRNGTQGQIVDCKLIDSKNVSYEVTVSLDANTYARFNSQDYLELNHAYATTLHKAQGQTVDWSYIVASKNMDAFATYVALTRHRLEAKVFYDEKTFVDFKALQSALGRVSHKDLAIDYTIAAEHQLAWENVQEYKLLGQDLSATLEEQDWEGYQSLKAERVALGKIILKDWEDHAPYARQAGITEESMAIACGEKLRPLSLAELEAKTNVNTYAEKALQARLIWREIRQTHPGKNCYQHERYAEFNKLRQERNALAVLMVEQKPLYREWVSDLGKTQGIGWKTLVSQATQGIDFKISEKNPSRELVSESVIQSSRNPAFSREYIVRVEPQQVKDELQQRIGLLAHTLLGEPQHKNAREWRYGNKGSILISVAGTKQGLYADFEAGSYGGPLKLIQDRLSVDHKEAYKWAMDWLGHSRTLSQRIPIAEFKLETIPKRNIFEKQWIPIYPVPIDKHNPDLKSDKNLSYQLTQYGRVEVERYPYKDAGGNLLGYAVRLENKQGEKVVLPLTYCQDDKGNQQWRWQGFGCDRPLYGLDRLAAHPTKSILIVEGEKTVNQAQSLFPERVVISWPGGTGAALQVDWSPVIGKNITLWPDNDKSGHKAMEQIEAHLVKLNQERGLEPQVQKVILPLDTPEKWDLADPLPQGWPSQKLMDLLGSKEKFEKALVSESDINDMLKKYTLSKGNSQLIHFQEGVKYFYEQMLHWHGVLGVSLSAERQQQLLEKAVLSQAVVSQAKQEYCSGSSHLEAKLRSEDLALITAGLLQQHGDKGYKTKFYLEQANRILGEQNDVKKEILHKEYRSVYPNVTDKELRLLVEQDCTCRNTINKLLDPATQQKILSAAHQFEVLDQQGEVLKSIQFAVREQTPCYKKETDKSVAPMLERQFMKIAIAEGTSGKETLEKSAQSTKNMQSLLEQRHQQLIQIKMQEISLSKDQERER